MTGREGRRPNGNGGRGGRKPRQEFAGGKGGHSGYGRTRSTKVGLNKELEGNIFDLGERSSADLMRSTQIKIAQYIGSMYGGDIMGELDTKKEFVAPLPTYPLTALERQPVYEKMVRTQHNNILKKLNRRKERITAEIDENPTEDRLVELEEKLMDLENQALQCEYDLSSEIKVPLNEEEKGQWKTKEKAYGERVQKHAINQQKAFAIIIGQCTQRLQDKMHDDAQWDAVNKAQKPLELYALIERVVMKQTGDEYPPSNVVDNLLAVLLMKQQTNQSNAQWYEKLNTRVDVAESVGVQFDSFKCLLDYCIEQKGWTTYDDLTEVERKIIREESKERLLAYLLIKNSSSTNSHDLVRNNLLESFIAKRDEYPLSRSDAIAILNKYDEKKPSLQVASDGTAFAQKGKKIKAERKDSDSVDKKNYFADKECFICGKKGHGAKSCPEKVKGESSEDSTKSKFSVKNMKELEQKLNTANKQFAQFKSQMEDDVDTSSESEKSHIQFLAVGADQLSATYKSLSFKQSKGKMNDINLRKVILLDNQSTMSLFCNKRLVTDVRETEETMTLQSNGGSMNVNKVASIGSGQPPVWFSDKAITNILCLKDAIARYRVTYDSENMAFVIHREEKGLHNMVFKMHNSGLHYYDPSKEEFAFINTVHDNKLPFTKRQLKNAEKAKELYASLAYPSDADYKWILKTNQIKNCPVSMEDAEVAKKVWGQNVASLKGKTTRKTPTHVNTDIVAVPAMIRDLHRNVTLAVDIFYINNIPFMMTLSRNLCFTTVTHLNNRKTETIYKAFAGIFKYYLQRGFQIMTVTGDNEFSSIEEKLFDLPGAPRLNVTSANEHEPYIERRIRVVKERVRSVRHSLPFKTIPTKMVTHMVFFVVKLLNYFPTTGGVSEVYSPKTIMSGEVINYKQYCLPFGTYCQVHEEDSPRNNMAPRTQGAISMGPNNNQQGGQIFYTLTTGKIVVRRSWNVLPMPDAVINRVNKLAEDQPQILTFYDKHQRAIGDEDTLGENTNDNDDYEIPGVVQGDTRDHIQITGVEDEIPVNTITNSEKTNHGMDDLDMITTTEQPMVEEDLSMTDTANTEDVTEYTDNQPTELTEDPPRTVTEVVPRKSTRTIKRVKFYEPNMKGKSYEYAATQMEMENYVYDAKVVEFIFTQLSLKAAIRAWGNNATTAAEAEMKQLHWRNSFKPKKWNELTMKQKEMILESHIFITQKRTGEIKGRTVAGGNKQRNYIDKEEASSPTVATESVILTSMIDATEERDVAVIDIPNAFIQTKVTEENKRVIIRIRGMLVDILVKLAPDIYSEYVTITKRGEKQLLVECLNAI
ncbi:MAG: hypothetical protein ACRCZ9_11980, partial [Fusobacteriaceae bacterium]